MSQRSREQGAGAALMKANGPCVPRAEEAEEQGTVFIDSLGITYLDSPRGFQYARPNAVKKGKDQAPVKLIDENGVTTTLLKAEGTANRNRHKEEAASTSQADKSCKATPDEAESMQCFRCHIIFKSMPSKLRHMKRDHPEDYAEYSKRQPHMEERKRFPRLGHYACLECGKTFTNRKMLLWHRSKHRQSFPCEVCCRRFDLHGDLVMHQLAHLRDEPDQAARPSICKECAASFPSRRGLELHEQTHLSLGHPAVGNKSS